MSSKNIEIGNKLELVSVVKKEEPQETRVYKSQILDIMDNHRLQIATPLEGYKVLLLPVGGRYDVTIFSGSVLYTCQVRIMDRYKVRNQYVMDVELVTPLRKNQRRAFYRLEYTKDIQYRFLLEEEEEMESQALKISIYERDYFFDKGILLDLSGGGCRFVSKEPIKKGDKVVIKIPLEVENEEGEKEMSLMAQAVMSKVMENQGGLYEQRMEFVGIENAQREEIVKFIFERERRNRQNGKS